MTHTYAQNALRCRRPSVMTLLDSSALGEYWVSLRRSIPDIHTMSPLKYPNISRLVIGLQFRISWLSNLVLLLLPYLENLHKGR